MVLQGEPNLPLSAVREQVHASLDVIVHVERGSGGHRRIAAIAEVVDLRHEPGGAGVRVLVDGDQVVDRPRRARATRR